MLLYTLSSRLSICQSVCVPLVECKALLYRVSSLCLRLSLSLSVFLYLHVELYSALCPSLCLFTRSIYIYIYKYLSLCYSLNVEGYGTVELNHSLCLHLYLSIFLCLFSLSIYIYLLRSMYMLNFQTLFDVGYMYRLLRAYDVTVMSQ